MNLVVDLNKMWRGLNIADESKLDPVQLLG